MHPYLQAAELTRLTQWWPRIVAAGVPVPRTSVYPLPSGAVFALFDGQDLDPVLEPAAVTRWITESELGYPLFLRTDVLASKHAWHDTCYVAHPDVLIKHIGRLFDDTIGLADLEPQALVAREFLDLDTGFTAFAGETPIGAERRYFIQDGAVVCHHPYWPEDAIARGSTKRPLVADWKTRLAALNTETPDEVRLLTAYATKLAGRLPGAWSVDFARLRNGGWIFIDAAWASISYHPDCPEGPRLLSVPLPLL